MLLVASCSRVSSSKFTQEPGSSPAPKAASAPAQTQTQDWTKTVSWLFSPPQATPAPLTDAKVPSLPNAPVAAQNFQPNPAQGAKEAAIKMYPQLAVKDSTFNKTFRDLYLEESQKHPQLLTQADWPLILAHRTADILTPPAPIVPAGPTGSAPQVADAKSKWPSPTPSSNPLDRGAYNQARSPYWWGPWIRTY
ncbi:hypothetical protein CfE428DRAFT_5260 [Chthoniobacter flavus Ellin428]|uniref:Uncharacterized protein n=1 Tax=Chthoniobacter flavus Ellin428 TaxID=497964 RepID=B4D8M0_9BACT|nr:hypothetical protein CfE428DRAFT_5260 [Chthoniobacter flavus Ellin428]